GLGAGVQGDPAVPAVLLVGPSGGADDDRRDPGLVAVRVGASRSRPRPHRPDRGRSSAPVRVPGGQGAARSPAATRGHVRPRPPRPLRRRADRALAPATLFADGLLLLTRRLSGLAEGLACRAPGSHPVLRRRGDQPAATVHRAWRPGKRRPGGTSGSRGPRTSAGPPPRRSAQPRRTRPHPPALPAEVTVLSGRRRGPGPARAEQGVARPLPPGGRWGPPGGGRTLPRPPTAA